MKNTLQSIQNSLTHQKAARRIVDYSIGSPVVEMDGTMYVDIFIKPAKTVSVINTTFSIPNSFAPCPYCQQINCELYSLLYGIFGVFHDPVPGSQEFLYIYRNPYRLEFYKNDVLLGAYDSIAKKRYNYFSVNFDEYKDTQIKKYEDYEHNLIYEMIENFEIIYAITDDQTLIEHHTIVYKD